MMIKYIIGLFLVLILVWSPKTLQAEHDFYFSLTSKIGVLRNQEKVVQYANVNYCGKTVSITAEHIVKVMPEYSPNSRLIVKNKEFDLAIYDILGPGNVSPLATKLPLPFEVLYIPTFLWTENVNVVYQTLVVGYLPNRTLVQNIGFFGMSGSGAYDIKGEYIGPAIRMFTAPGFVIPELPGITTEQQVGIVGIGRTDKLIELFTKEVCGK